MKAIETFYKGYKFRSRLEARWAVFFTEIGLKWLYEPEGFILSDGTHYLPDFKIISPISNVACWAEVKAIDFTGDNKMEIFKADLEKEETDDNNSFWKLFALTLKGDPKEFIESGNIICPRCGLFTMNENCVYGSDRDEKYFNCWHCDFDTPGGGGNPIQDGLLCEVRPHKGVLVVEQESLMVYNHLIKSAISEARGKRFEYSERSV